MHPIYSVPGKALNTVFKGVELSTYMYTLMYVKESNARDRRLKPRHEITCFMIYANNKDT